jgi:oligopeptide transport system permease protein
MMTYIIRRLLAMIPALLGIATITFALMHLTKGGPFTTEHPNPAVTAALNSKYHLDEPIWPTILGPGSEVYRYVVLGLAIALVVAAYVIGRRWGTAVTVIRSLMYTLAGVLLLWFVLMVTQSPGTSDETGFVGGQYFRYLGSLLQGDLGNSFTFTTRSVADIIGSGAANSLVLGLTAFAILVLIAIPLGVLAAVRQNSWVDYLATGVSLIGYSIPNFVMGVLFILAFGLWLKWIPIAAWEQFPRDLILPAIVLAIRPMAVLTRLTRASMIEVLNQDYIRTAWAKGLGSRMVLIRHALRNALLPVVTVMGDHLGDLITGSIVVEFLFNVPGIGQWFVTSVQRRDYSMIMGTTLFYASLVLLINLVVDLLYAVIDPRIKLGAAARS